MWQSISFQGSLRSWQRTEARRQPPLTLTLSRKGRGDEVATALSRKGRGDEVATALSRKGRGDEVATALSRKQLCSMSSKFIGHTREY